MFNLQEEQLSGDLEKKYLLVDISNVVYALPISAVCEVMPMIEIFLADSSANIKGVIKLRKENIPVYDLRNILGKETSIVNKKQKLVILQLNYSKIAVIVDDLLDIIYISDGQIFDFALTEKFLRKAIVDGKNIAFVDEHEFYKYIVSFSNPLQLPATKLVPIEKSSADLIKTRTEIINKEDDYVLTNDAFINEKFVVFRLNDEIYAFNILYIEEIKKINDRDVSKIPCVPDFIRGIINAKGDYISLIDIKAFLNMAISHLQPRMDIIIINVNGLRVALLVDEIIDIECLPLPKMVSTSSFVASFIKGEISYNELLINMLDVEKIFSTHNINIENYDID